MIRDCKPCTQLQSTGAIVSLVLQMKTTAALIAKRRDAIAVSRARLWDLRRRARAVWREQTPVVRKNKDTIVEFAQA